MKSRIIYLITGILLSTSIFAQSKKDCKKLLKKEISYESMLSEPEEFYQDFSLLVLCEFDTIDFHIFWGSTSIQPIIGALLLGLEMENKTTFKDLRDLIQGIKKEPAYDTLRHVVKASLILFSKTATLANWENDRQYMQEMGAADSMINKIYLLVQQHDGQLTYRDIWLLWAEEEVEIMQENPEIKRIEKLTKQAAAEKQKFLEYLYVYTDYDLGIQRGQEANSPILIYFTAYGGVNCRELESEILVDEDIALSIMEKFQMIVLYVDDKSPFEAGDYSVSGLSTEEISTMGEYNSIIQKEIYAADHQPFFVLVNSNNEIIATQSFTRNKNAFKSFLKKQ
jgi:hypothetical protein